MMDGQGAGLALGRVARGWAAEGCSGSDSLLKGVILRRCCGRGAGEAAGARRGAVRQRVRMVKLEAPPGENVMPENWMQLQLMGSGWGRLLKKWKQEVPKLAGYS